MCVIAVIVPAVLTLAEVEEAGGEDGRAEEAQKDGATDEAETHILLLRAKLLSDGTEGVAELTGRTKRGRRGGRGGWGGIYIHMVSLCVYVSPVEQAQEHKAHTLILSKGSVGHLRTQGLVWCLTRHSYIQQVNQLLTTTVL